MALPAQTPSSATHRLPRRVDLATPLGTLLIGAAVSILAVRTELGWRWSTASA